MSNVLIQKSEMYRREDSSRVSQPVEGKTSVAWLSTRYNYAIGYSLYELDRWEIDWVKNSGLSTDHVYRTFNEKYKSFSIVKLDLEKHKVAFVDGEEEYKTGLCKFGRSFKWNSLIIETNCKSM